MNILELIWIGIWERIQRVRLKFLKLLTHFSLIKSLICLFVCLFVGWFVCLFKSILNKELANNPFEHGDLHALPCLSLLQAELTKCYFLQTFTSFRKCHFKDYASLVKSFLDGAVFALAFFGMGERTNRHPVSNTHVVTKWLHLYPLPLFYQNKLTAYLWLVEGICQTWYDRGWWLPHESTCCTRGVHRTFSDGPIIHNLRK